MSRLVTTSKTDLPNDLIEAVITHLHLPDESQKAEVKFYLESAIDQAEMYTGQAVYSKGYTFFLPSFPGEGVIELPRSPVTAVGSIKYRDEDGQEVTLAASSYFADLTDAFAPRIHLKPSATWPATEQGNPASVSIAFTAGYGQKTGDLPALLRAGIVLFAGHLFLTRSAQGAGELGPILDRFFLPYKARWY